MGRVRFCQLLPLLCIGGEWKIEAVSVFNYCPGYRSCMHSVPAVVIWRLLGAASCWCSMWKAGSIVRGAERQMMNIALPVTADTLFFLRGGSACLWHLSCVLKEMLKNAWGNRQKLLLPKGHNVKCLVIASDFFGSKNSQNKGFWKISA